MRFGRNAHLPVWTNKLAPVNACVPNPKIDAQTGSGALQLRQLHILSRDLCCQAGFFQAPRQASSGMRSTVYSTVTLLAKLRGLSTSH